VVNLDEELWDVKVKLLAFRISAANRVHCFSSGSGCISENGWVVELCKSRLSEKSLPLPNTELV